MYLRTTTTATNNTMLGYIMTNQSTYNELSAQASTQKKLNTPSDNATDAISVLNINKSLSQLNGYLGNMSQSQNELNMLDTSLASITKTLQRANDLTVQAATGTNSAATLGNIKIEIDQIIKTLQGLGNAQFNGSYIFAGTNVGTVPFQENTVDGGVTYVGTPQTDDYERYIQISQGVETAINVPGDKLLGFYDADATGTPPVPTGSGIFKTLYELSAALGTTPTTPASFDAIRSKLTGIQDGITNISSVRTNFASITNRFNMTATSIQNNIVQLKSFKSGMEDVDLATTMSNLSQQELALKATMAVASQSMKSASLLDYI